MAELLWKSFFLNLEAQEFCGKKIVQPLVRILVRKKHFFLFLRVMPFCCGLFCCWFWQKELVQLFSEVGSVQDAHLQPGKDRGYTYGSVLRNTAMFDNFDTLYYFFTFSCISCFSLLNKVFVGLPVAELIKFLVASWQKRQSWGCITQKGCVSPPPAMGTIIWLLSGELFSVINKKKGNNNNNIFILLIQ